MVRMRNTDSVNLMHTSHRFM